MTASTQQPQPSRAILTLTALGIVYGDIGTSPLYAVKETFDPEYGIPLIRDNIVGGLSAIFWALMMVVSLKYVILILRADNKGEGGILALLALALSSVRERPQLHGIIILLGVIGLSLFYGDAVLTPAISVVSAVEGLEVGTSALKPYILPVATGVLIALFAMQRHGTSAVGTVFGPIILLWFGSLATVGVFRILQHSDILEALNPLRALAFLTGHGIASFLVLGAVLLAFTGAEALYADMGHFGRGPIRFSWFLVVLPALALNYLGQGALLIGNPDAITNPFYLAFPSWALYPMVVLATAATVIASQATISGAYSLTRQAIQLGFLPRMHVIHTSSKVIGQVYLPLVTRLLLLAVLGAVLGFGSSSNLAGAYGVAVTFTMLVDTLLALFIARYYWRYSLMVCVCGAAVFLSIDVAFFSSSLVKIAEGGWFPLTVGAAMFAVMLTWRRGRELLFARLKQLAIPLDQFLKSLFIDPPHRVPGIAVFLTATPDATPHALLHNLKHNKVLHDTIIFLTVSVKDVPWVPDEERAQLEDLGQGCWRVLMQYGFKDEMDVTDALTRAMARQGQELDMMQTSFFLSREIVIPVSGEGMAMWRERMFATLQKNARSVVEYFNIPPNRVIELGTQVEM